MGTGLGHFIPLLAYLSFWAMCIVSLTSKPKLGLYYLIPFLPYRTLRDHFLTFPLGANVFTILAICVLIGAFIQGKRIPKSKLYTIWLVYALYLYLSMWVGTAMGNAPAPLWTSDLNFATWKGYMLIPLIFTAAGMLIDDRKAVRIVIILTALSVLLIDRSSLMESMSRTWTNFDEDKRSVGPLGYGANQTAAYLAQFAMFFWGFAQFLKRRKLKLIVYAIVAATIWATMFTFSRAAYLALIVSVFALGLMKDRKLIVILGVFLLTWQTIVPVAVRERVSMTKTANGQLETSAEERVELWQGAEQSFMHSPIVGNGYATYQMKEHVDDLRDTHNWYVKVLVETGIVGFLIILFLLQQLLALSFRLFRKATDPMYRGLGLGLFLALCCSLVTNMFGDRWTYVEITAPIFVLAAAAIRALEFSVSETASHETAAASTPSQTNPYLAYR